eukprot:1139742-Pelagomonas_calceolata.AAC.1
MIGDGCMLGVTKEGARMRSEPRVLVLVIKVIRHHLIFELVDILCVAGTFEQAEPPHYLANGQSTL